MGISNSKTERCEALRLCKERKKCIKVAIGCRYDFSAAHLAYLQSLGNIGIALTRFAETQVSPPGLSFMKSVATDSLTVTLNPSNIVPPPESTSSWDFFDHQNQSFRFRVDFNDMSVHKQHVQHSDLNDGFVTPPEFLNKHNHEINCEPNSQTESNKDTCFTEEERDDDYITHRAKDFLSSIKEIESRFFRASECGKEVSRMLETHKIRFGFSEAKGSSSASTFSCVNCCTGKTTLDSHEPSHVTKVITWKRSTSSHSSSSRNPLTPMKNDDNDGGGSDFLEEFCMIAGSHSSTLDRLYAWERKLYDEVKASESIRKEYDRKCDQLRHQFAKDKKTHVIDKTRALVKNLHSRIIVALHTVDSISKRIEKIRDEELQPQLLELIQGLNRLWKAMLECHHAQYITISLAYHLEKPKEGTRQEETQKQIMVELQREIECFGLSFANMVNSHTSYIESINNWLQNCIIQPKERIKRRPFSPRRSVAPPMFVICRDWSADIQTLPSQLVSDAIEAFLSHLRQHSVNDLDQTQTTSNEEEDKGEDTRNDDVTPLNMWSIHSSLTKVLNGLTKFSEASLKMYEDIKQKSETAQNVYSNYRPPSRAYSI